MNNNNSFDISAGSYTLVNNDKTSELLSGTKYVIPVYQRPYSWGEEQIKKFLGDILKSYHGSESDEKILPRQIFIGTMQLSQKEGEIQEIIDGQQRITTFLVLFKVLKWMFPDTIEVKELKLDWLETRVNGGKQQSLLEEFIKLEQAPDKIDDSASKYLQNATVIQDILINEIIDNNDEDKAALIILFLKHLHSNIYFVVIATKAGLSETLKIFDTINTTGLDLAAGDLFKIRMYEYLKLKKPGSDDKIFDDINRVYALIDEKNKDFNVRHKDYKKNVTDITDILSIYQYILIASNELPNTLYTYATGTFYDRLFETIFKINDWEHFPDKLNKNILLDDIEKLIKIRFEWEEKWVSDDYGTAENAALMHLWWRSRYGRYWKLIFVFLYGAKNKSNEYDYDKMYLFTKTLVRFYLIYSILYKKSVTRIKSGFNDEMIKMLLGEESTEDKTIRFIEQQITDMHDKDTKDSFKAIISGDIFENAKVKNILCRTSALLEENYLAPDSKKEIRKKLFESKIDIEHIQSRNDEKHELRAEIIEEWGTTLNSLGNLVVLEEGINREIGNTEANKLCGYSRSEYQIVSKLIETYKKDEQGWDKAKCEERCDSEVTKLMNYFFDGNV